MPTITLPTRKQTISALRFLVYACAVFGPTFAAAEPPVWITACVIFGGLLAQFRLNQLTDEEKDEVREAIPHDTQQYIAWLEQRERDLTAIARQPRPPAVPAPPSAEGSEAQRDGGTR